MNKVQCPICAITMSGPMAEWPDYPFCSARCRKIDLGRWLSERYSIPAEGEADSSGAAEDE